MRKIIVVLLIVFVSASTALAANVEFQAKNVGNPGIWTYTTTVEFGEQISPMFGWTGFVLSSNTWGEAYVGPTFKPANWITVAVCAGIQNSPQVSRFAGWYYISHGKFSLLHVVEDGDGRWHQLLIAYDFGPAKIQYWDENGLGHGSRIEIKGPQRIVTYVGLMFDGSQTNTAIGIIKGF